MQVKLISDRVRTVVSVVQEIHSFVSTDAVNQYTFEEYLDELSTMLEDVLYDENSVPQVEPIFYPNVDDTSGYNDSSNTAKGTGEYLDYDIERILIGDR